MSRRLAAELGLEHLDLGDLVRKKRRFSGYDKERGAFIVDERAVQGVVGRLAVEGFVFSTHFVGSMLPPSAVRKCLVLRLDPVVLFRRLRARGWTRAKSWENAESEMIDVSYSDAVVKLGRAKVSEVDTTGKSRAKVFRDALEVLSGRAGGARRGRVNWLKAYDPVELARRFGVEQEILDR